VLTKRREELRWDLKDAKARQPKPIITKYIVAQINLRAFFWGFVGLLALMFFRQRDEWSEPLFFVYMEVLIACLAVQPWVRRTPSFWFSLAISCVYQFVIGHWLSVYHPAFVPLSLLAGYAFCAAVFVLLQKLKPEADGSSNKP